MPCSQVEIYRRFEEIYPLQIRVCLIVARTLNIKFGFMFTLLCSWCVSLFQIAVAVVSYLEVTYRHLCDVYEWSLYALSHRNHMLRSHLLVHVLCHTSFFYGSWCILYGKIRSNAFKVISTFGFTGLVVTIGVTWEEERGDPMSLQYFFCLRIVMFLFYWVVVYNTYLLHEAQSFLRS